MRRDKWDKNDGPLKLIWFPPDSGNHLLLAWWMCLTGYAFKHLEINELVNRWESSGSIRFNSLWSRESVTFWRGQESLDPPGRIVKSLALDLKPSAEFSTGLFVHWWNGSESCLVMSYSLKSYGLYSPWNSLGQNTGVGSPSLLQEIFPTQGLNPGLPQYRQILYQLSHQGSPILFKRSRILTKS